VKDGIIMEVEMIHTLWELLFFNVDIADAEMVRHKEKKGKKKDRDLEKKGSWFSFIVVFSDWFMFGAVSTR
jgi:hypothetical protein